MKKKSNPDSHDSEAGPTNRKQYGAIGNSPQSLEKGLNFNDIVLGERIGMEIFISFIFLFVFLSLGRGSFGEVYSGMWYSTPVAVKKLPLEVYLLLFLCSLNMHCIDAS